jgi:2'-5' RNA ligase
MKQKTIRLNIAIVPPARIAKEARAQSKKIATKDALFRLDHAHLPHLTVYMANFPVEALPQIKKVLRVLPLNLKDIHFMSPGVIVKDDGYIEVRYRRTKGIERLQKQIISTFNPLRGGAKSEAQALHLMPKASQEKFRVYGYPAVGADYHPHISLARFKKPQAISSPSNAELKRFEFKAETLGIYLVGESDTCRKLLMRRS